MDVLVEVHGKELDSVLPEDAADVSEITIQFINALTFIF
jgi:hypothetical protein